MVIVIDNPALSFGGDRPYELADEARIKENGWVAIDRGHDTMYYPPDKAPVIRDDNREVL